MVQLNQTGYFGTLETPLLAGRDFNAHDTATSPRVAIVNEQFAKIVFGGESPIGRVFRHQAPAGEPEPEYQVVGLVRNTKYGGLREEFRAIAFLPVAQEKDPSRTASPSWSARVCRWARRWPASAR